MTTVTLRNWQPEKVKAANIETAALWLNNAGLIGVTRAQLNAPRDTGFMANTITILHRARPGAMFVAWGNITALYTLWQEIGARGKPGKYFLRQSLQYAGQQFGKNAGKVA